MTVVDPGTRLSRVVATSEGAAVAIYSHGRFRDGRVVKVTPTRALVEFEASADGRVKRLYRHVSGQMRHWSEYLYVVDRAGPLVVSQADGPRSGHRLWACR